MCAGYTVERDKGMSIRLYQVAVWFARTLHLWQRVRAGMFPSGETSHLDSVCSPKG